MEGATARADGVSVESDAADRSQLIGLRLTLAYSRQWIRAESSGTSPGQIGGWADSLVGAVHNRSQVQPKLREQLEEALVLDIHRVRNDG